MAFQVFVQKHESCAYSQIHARSRGGTIVLGENKKEYRYEYVPRETFLEIRIDGGLVQDENESKCDFLLLNTTGMNTKEPNLHAIFIELKGTHFSTACRQLLATVAKFSTELTPAKLHARIVLSKMHNLVASGLQKIQKEFSNKKCSFDFQSRQMVEHTGKDGYPIRK